MKNNFGILLTALATITNYDESVQSITYASVTNATGTVR